MNLYKTRIITEIQFQKAFKHDLVSPVMCFYVEKADSSSSADFMVKPGLVSPSAF